ncbi:MAG: asparagine synthase (glutamine-hydrolyzing) [Betaproteobacteria bacterium HGW-Betaproteobacteria-5]|jgi:asparagine synthase (glutamine-hydrolysing)|nr:MAG: asparagine synthase (glutamine-hydrolyzing) [Betaproteobacteria bacterium HGW-Betaproteobacteria-5]PKO30671.1 MAG: asparagine synthase (glutamine-hydrolyzing) [Betaproteobacteria bacterium HGW-Betaproteobacteria-7]
MCGILGGVWQRGFSVTAPRFEEAIEALRFRGPDDSGVERMECAASWVALGHTRLSIIDLTSAGHQPMSSADGRHSIVFNGEIYNYLELRRELTGLGHAFSSNSDSEVLLAAWRQWGRECLPRLLGMFAFVVLDRESCKLTCVRDAFGIKPFFYAREDGRFLFASEIPAIKALKQEKVELDWQRAYDYLVHGDYDSGERSFLSGVFHLLPGHLLDVSLTDGAVSEPLQWWTPSIQERTDLSFDQAADLVRERFLANIRLHLRSDVPLGAALSGGIDSSAVVCAMRVVEPDLPINTFSYIAQGSSVSEEVWVDRVNRHVRAIPHKVVVNANELAADLDEMIRVQGEPFGSTSIYAQYRVFQLAREHGVTVTLDGQGADEMLAGYNGYPGQRIRSLLEKGRVAEAWNFLSEWAKWPGRTRFAGAKRAVAEMTQGHLYDALRRLNGMQNLPPWINADALEERGIIRRYPRQRSNANEVERRVVAELALSLTQRGLPALLRHGDRNSMRFSVESRVPFLTLDMVELLLSLPESYLISGRGETKSVFRAAMRGIVPDDVLDRRDKIGFATPEQEWLVSMADTVRGWLREDLGLPFFNQQEVVKAFDRIVSGKQAFSWQVWRWINFSRWYASFVA